MAASFRALILASVVLVVTGKNVLQVTCPKSCTNCMCSSCKNLTFPLGKCVGAGNGEAVKGACSSNGKVFTENIYLNKNCAGQVATKSQINTDACIEASETGQNIAFFCTKGEDDEEEEVVEPSPVVALKEQEEMEEVEKGKSVLQVTCPKSCSNCMCKSCKNLTFPLGKCVGAGSGEAVIGSCSGDGSKFTENIYLNKNCAGQVATKSVINTDACIEASESKQNIAFFCPKKEEAAAAPKPYALALGSSGDSAVTAMSAELSRVSSGKGNPTDYGNPSKGCRSGEVNVTIEGMSNASFCSPKCTSQTAPVGHRCPTDLPADTTAQALCTIREPGSTGAPDRCSLVCAGLHTGDCPKGSTCQIIGLGMGACFWPTDASDVSAMEVMV